MKKKWMAVILAASLALPLGTEAEAFDGSAILGRILSGGIFREKKAKTVPAGTKISSGKENRYKNAMGVLQNMQWVGVARSSGGNIYFDQDTMKDTVRNGERRVTATIKNEFTKTGAKAVEKSSDGKVDRDDVSYSLFLVDFGEKDCFIASPVIYYDKKGKELIRRKPSEAYADVTGMNYGRPYGPDSMELQIKEKVFSYADRVKEEEKANRQNQ